MNRPSNNILITGSNGQLGCELRELLSDRGIAKENGWKIIYTDIAELDITDREAVYEFIRNNEIDIVVNCAAYTAVDNAEDEDEFCYRINGEAPSYLSEALAQNRADIDNNLYTPFIIHISTDYVFDGDSSSPYRENSATNPQTIYGESKLAGEKRVADSGVNYVIIRTSWLYSKYGKNFVETILKLSTERDELNVVHDQIGTPTNAVDLAGAIIEIISQSISSANGNTEAKGVNRNGIYHYSNEGICSWYQFANEIVRLSGRECKVNPVTTDKFPAKAKRPAYSVLDKSKIKNIYGIDIPDWRDSLAQYMAIRHKI